MNLGSATAIETVPTIRTRRDVGRSVKFTSLDAIMGLAFPRKRYVMDIMTVVKEKMKTVVEIYVTAQNSSVQMANVYLGIVEFAMVKRTVEMEVMNQDVELQRSPISVLTEISFVPMVLVSRKTGSVMVTRIALMEKMKRIVLILLLAPLMKSLVLTADVLLVFGNVLPLWELPRTSQILRMKVRSVC